jgi:heme-degrading monooxygenase HmoA
MGDGLTQQGAMPEGRMIVRSWRGRASATEPDAYPRHFAHRVLPALRGIDGFLGATLLREAQGETIEFLVLTRWASLAAIRAFAGEDLGRAVVEPEAVTALVSFDATVRHYEVVQEASAGECPEPFILSGTTSSA